ncbi:MAG: glycosyltransferase [Planctomycetota bacterium]|nr:glycosyltransferase [Planctomycetota bacterium]
MPCLILPAHNEESLLAHNLGRLLEGLRDDVRVLVVCNGCTDGTAKVARGFEPRIQVLDLEKPSKVGALNAADVTLEGFPRVYLDADVEVDGDSMNRVIEVLEAGALAAEPIPVLDTEGAGPLVKAYYAVWQALHGQRPGSVGSGLYGLSEEGRARFGAFPQLIADDGFVRAHFSPEEILWVNGASSRVRTPRRLADLVRIKTRSRLGNLELGRAYPELWQRKVSGGGGLSKKARRLPLRLWPALAVYVPFQLWVRLRAKRQAKNLAEYRWERDLSSRS